MLNLSLATIAEATQGRLHGAEARVDAVSTDSRKRIGNALFVALRGEQHDAHDFIAQARENGAVAALVEREADIDLPQVIVADVQIALGQIAAHVRRQRDVCVIGITGSNGKTTVKTLLAGILSRHAPTHASSGSFNNEIGLPLTLLAMPADTRFAVLEMGAGKPGDIDYLAGIAQPQNVYDMLRDVVVVFVSQLARAVLSPGAPGWRLVHVSDHGAALLFPSWVRLGTERRGFETMGQGLLTMLATSLAAAVALVFPAGLAILILWLGSSVLGPASMLVAAFVGAALLFAELWPVIFWLGSVFEKTEVTDIGLPQ